MAASTIIKGVYVIERCKTDGGKEYFSITGYKESGERIRLREDTETEAKKLKSELEGKDEVFCAAREKGSKEITEKKRSLFTSDLITTQARVTDCEDALRLFPKAPDGTPDERWLVKSAVSFALECGYNPDLPHILVNDVLELHWPHLVWRSELPRDREEHLGKNTFGTRKYHRIIVAKMFGPISLTTLASPGFLERNLVGSSLSVGNQQKVASYVNGLMEWAMVDNTNPLGDKPSPAHSKYIEKYTPYFPPKGKESKEVAIMNLAEIQLNLDAAWNHSMTHGGSRAAREIMLIFCFVRPSELDNPKFKLSESCKVAYVPDDSKTKWRHVKIPPNARIMLRSLKTMGLLTFEPASAQTRARWRGQMGYHLCDSAIRGYVAKLHKSNKNITVMEATKIFRDLFPLLPELGRWVPDKPRHTGGSFFLTACGDIGVTARQMGNSPKVVDIHYSGKVEMQDVPKFYQVLPSVLAGVHDASQIAMPSWFKIQDSDEDKAEELNVCDGEKAILDHVEKVDAEKVEARRQMLNRINRKCRAANKDKWNATNREKYANDETRRLKIRKVNHENYERKKEQYNATRRERYANDPVYREQLLSQKREIAKNGQTIKANAENPSSQTVNAEPLIPPTVQVGGSTQQSLKNKSA